MTPDLARRAYDHAFRIDPIVRSLLDTDFYKVLMLQMIWKLKRDMRVAFGLQNRTTRVRLADIVDRGELAAQLDRARRFERNELIWLTGNTFYGKEQIFEPAVIDFLRDFRLPPPNSPSATGRSSCASTPAKCLGSRDEIERYTRALGYEPGVCRDA